MFESLSGETQLILMVIGIAVLFILVFYNTRRNKNKLYNRRKRNFKDNVIHKRKEREAKKNSSS